MTQPNDDDVAKSNVRAVTGNAKDLDAATVFVRGSLHSAFGPVVGEQVFRKLPALRGLIWYKQVRAQIKDIGEQ